MAKKNTQSSKENFDMIKSLFDELYAEINELKKKKPDDVVNAFKVERINRVLNPLYDMMKGEPYAGYLELIPEPTEEKNGRSTVENGLTYSDVMVVLSQYNSGIKQYWKKYFYDFYETGF